MKLFGKRSVGPIGLDIGSRSIKAVQLAHGTGTPTVIAAMNVTPPERKTEGNSTPPLITGELALWLVDLLERQNFRGRSLVLAAPVSQIQCDVFDLPPRTSGAPIEQIAATEIARTGKLEANAFEMSSWDLPAASRAGTSVMAMAMRHADADALLDPLEQAGFEVLALDAPGCALARVAREEGAVGITAILDLGWNSTLLIFAREGQVIFQRNLVEIGLASLFRGVVTEFELTQEVAEFLLTRAGEGVVGSGRDPGIATEVTRFAAALLEEIDTSLAFAKHRYSSFPLEKLLLCGGGASVTGLCEQLGQRLSVKVETSRPDDVATFPAALLERAATPAIFKALGLACYQER